MLRPRALSRPDRRLQGFRGAISGGESAATRVLRALAAVDDIGGDFGRYGRRGGGRLPSSFVGTGRHFVPERFGKSAPGAATDLLGRQCAVAAHRWYVR